jgi:type II secretory pathway pseudopilin PulG
MTLLEIMLALLILGTVVTMVSITLSGSLNVLNSTRTRGEIYHRAQVALLRMSEDIGSAVLVADVDFVGTEEQIGGQDAHSLQFTSTAHVVFNREEDNPGIALISYIVQEDAENEGGLVLIRSDHLLATAGDGTDGGEIEGGLLLCDRLRSVKLSYFDEEGEELDTWTTEEDAFDNESVRKLPVAVSIILEFWVDRENDVSIEFSTRVLLPVGLINAQSSQNTP